MTTQAPLTPADCDLRDFAYMPVDVRRLLSSETWILGNGDERAAAMTLWLESWHQVPAGSIPNNDKMLAHLSQAGAKWGKVKEHVLRGWVEARDGRLYHPVIAEKVREAWQKKQVEIRVRAADCAKKAARRRAAPAWLSLDQRREIRDIYQRSALLTAGTGIRHEVDHIVPLNGDAVCGLHVPWNLQILTAKENSEKSNRLEGGALHA